MPEMPVYIWLLVVLGVAGMSGLTAVGLYRGARRSGRGPRGAAGLAVGFAAVWAGVVAAAVLLTEAGAFRQSTAERSPWFGLFVGGAFALALLGAALPPVRDAFRAPESSAWLVWPQTLRVVGGVFLLVLALDRLPAVFALPAALGDLAVGVGAPVIARRLARRDRRGAVPFQLLGMLDLVVALTIGALAAPGPGRILVVSPATVALTDLPLVLIPATAVPLALALHVTALWRLRTQASQGARVSAWVSVRARSHAEP